MRLDVAYDGTDFSGWARQPGRRTVCGVLSDALATVLRVPVELTVAGRTDAGVHATGQVAHTDLPAELVPDDPSRFLRRMARLLPPDVRLRALRPAPADFDARFAALRRHYAYRVSTTDHGADPLRARDTVSWSRPLDVDAVRAASAPLLGTHDFAAYCRAREGATTIRELQRLDWEHPASGADAGVLTAHVSADAFCHSMVRSLVGALLAVGEGRRDPTWPGALLAHDRRSSSVPVAPAHGLTLVAVDYPPDADLAERTARTRAVRSRDHLDQP